MSTNTEISGIPSKKFGKTVCAELDYSRKTDHVNEHDHISNLPDCVLSHILSRLSTMDAVRTSILSKDWEYKWTSINNIDIDYFKKFKAKNKEATFVDFVERTLLFAQNVQNLRLSCFVKHYTDRVKTWISVALHRNVHCLQIYNRKARIKITLPRNFFNCYSLRELELNMPCTFKVPAKICYPNLNYLMLEQVEIFNELSDSDPVKFDFPVLETFKLRKCKWLNVKFVEIYAPKMTSFESNDNTGENDYSIKITGDSLLRFDSSGDCLPENIILSGSPPVVHVSLVHHMESDDIGLLEKGGLEIRKLLKGFSCLEELVIAGCVAKVIAQSKLGISLPKYHRLKRLSLYAYADTEALLELLHAAPFMKFLHIVMARLSNYDYDGVDCVPPCIVSHLKVVELDFFAGKMHEFELTKFFLKNALHLKRLCVSIFSCYNPSRPLIPKNEVVEKLSTYPRASTCVKIVVK